MWDLIITFLILCIAIINPYEIAFQDRNKVKWFDIFIGIVLSLDIDLNFFSFYTNDEKNLVKNHRKIIS